MEQPPRKKRPIWPWIVGIIVVSALYSGVGQLLSRPQSSTGHASAEITQHAATPTPIPAPTPTLTSVPPTPTPTPRPAYELAFLDAGGSLPEDDPSIGQYQSLLDKLHAKTGDSEQTIADQTVKGQQILHDKGKDVKLLDLLQGVDTAVTSKSENVHYDEALAALITLMTS